MDKAMSVFVCIFIGFAILSGMSVLREWSDCRDSDGQMVQGLSWNGYVCVHGVK
jgi:hypothetical protein